MNILVVGERFSANLGDAVICETVSNLIREKYPHVKVDYFDMSGKVDFNNLYPLGQYAFRIKLFLKFSDTFPNLMKRSAYYRHYQMDETRHLRVLCMLNEISRKKYDLVVFAGGALFMDYFAGIIYSIVRHFRKRHAKIIFHACGMGNLSRDSIALLKKVFSCPNVCSVSLRDSYERFQENFRLRIPVMETFDPALCCAKYYHPASEKKAEYGVGVIALRQYYEAQKEIIRFFLNSNFSWKIFTNGANDDVTVARKILNELNVPEDKQKQLITERPTCAQELVTIVTSFDKIISFRMHSQIIASAFCNKSFGLIWDSKVQTFYTKLGFPENCTTPEEFVETPEAFIERTMDESRLYKKIEIQSNTSQKNMYMQIEDAVATIKTEVSE